MRGFTARSVEEARNSFLFAVPLAGVVFIAAPAYSALLGGEDIVTGDALSAVLTGLTATAAIAACLALGSGLLLAMANGLPTFISSPGMSPPRPSAGCSSPGRVRRRLAAVPRSRYRSPCSIGTAFSLRQAGCRRRCYRRVVEARQWPGRAPE